MTKYNTETGEAMASQPSPFEPSQPRAEVVPPLLLPPSELSANPHQIAARGLARMFLLHPMPAAFAIVVDAMESAINVATLEISAPILWLAGGVVTTVVVWIAQRKWGGDDEQEAFCKAIAVGFLVSLPTPFPAWLTVPSAIAGTVQILRRKG